MRFSIVTPNYNYGRFLRKALESVLAQVNDSASGRVRLSGGPSVPGGASRPGESPLGRGRPPGGSPIEIEHIVMDGGSTDDSVQILKDWPVSSTDSPPAKAGRYSFFFVSEPDKGQTDAINKGLRRATGDIFAWLNADEWYEPGALAKMAEAFDKRPKADLIYGEVRFVDETGKTIRVKRDHRFSGFVLLWYGCYISSAATFWRRRVLDAGDYLDASYKVCMDFEYWVRLWQQGYRFSFLPVTIASFTWHNNNVSEVFAARRRDERNKVQDLYAMTILRTGKGQAKGAVFFGLVAHQLHRILVLGRRMFS